VLVPFDLHLETRLSTDASFAMGVALLQKHEGQWCPVAYASRTLIPAESNYASIEKEALAMCWAAEKFYFYLPGRHFEIETDHCPLLAVMERKELVKLSIRLQRFRLRMLGFDYSVRYTVGSKLVVADALSIISLGNDGSLCLVDHAVVQELVDSLLISECMRQEIQATIFHDDVGRWLLRYIEVGWLSLAGLDPGLEKYYPTRHFMTFVDGMVFLDQKIFIPESGREKILGYIHRGYLGEVKCIQRAKKVLRWPGITSDMRNVVSSCKTCAEFRRMPK